MLRPFRNGYFSWKLHILIMRRMVTIVHVIALTQRYRQQDIMT